MVPVDEALAGVFDVGGTMLKVAVTTGPSTVTVLVDTTMPGMSSFTSARAS